MTEEQKELVTLAAKAMGFEGKWKIIPSSNIGKFKQVVHERTELFSIGGGKFFNPITSDSDCFRMETYLEIEIWWNKGAKDVSAYCDDISIEAIEPYGSDKAASRRLASTRVAAEIQRRKESKDVL